MLKLACVHSNTSHAKQNYRELEESYEFVSPEQADVIVTLGGDGQMLNTLHAYMHLEKPIYGMNSGSVGFLMNEFQQDRLIERVEAASTYKLYPLATEAVTKDGETIEDLAFNEVAVTRGTGQSANIRIVVDDVVRLDRFMGDGIIVSTPAGSTAYNLSAHGPIIPLGSNLLALTPVSPFRPRRWRGALLPRKTRIELINLDVDNRPLSLTADFNEYSNIQSAIIWEDATRSVNVLFDKNHSLEERVIREQFTE